MRSGSACVSASRPGPAKPAVRKRVLDEKKCARDKRLHDLGQRLAEELGPEVFDDHNRFVEKTELALAGRGEKLGTADKKALLRGRSWRDDDAHPVVKKVTKGIKALPDPLHGRFLTRPTATPKPKPS